MLMQNCH